MTRTKPTPESFGLPADTSAVEELHRRVVVTGHYLIPVAVATIWVSVLGFRHGIGYYLLVLPIVWFLVFIAGTVMGMLCVWCAERLWFRNLLRYRRALAEYEVWVQRTRREFWQSLDGLAFEREVAALLVRLGHRPRLTPASGDGGVDIALEDGTVIQCKAYRHRVSPAVIRDLYGTIQHLRAPRAILVAPAGFSRGIHAFAKDKPIALWDVETLIGLQARAGDEPPPARPP